MPWRAESAGRQSGRRRSFDELLGQESARVAGFVADGVELVVLSVPSEDAPAPSLTAAEREVLACVRAGLRNAGIAAARETSPRTVANQIARLLRKFGVGSRAELALVAGALLPRRPPHR